MLAVLESTSMGGVNDQKKAQLSQLELHWQLGLSRAWQQINFYKATGQFGNKIENCLKHFNNFGETFQKRY